jgi:hypothetical protein
VRNVVRTLGREVVLHSLDDCYVKRSPNIMSGGARPIIYQESASTVSL